MLTKRRLDALTYEIIGGAIEVHKIIGRGLLESIYHQCLKENQYIGSRYLSGLTELKIPVVYKGKQLDMDFRCDLFVENSVVVELKSVKEFIPAYEAQLLTYMKLLRCPKGVLINLTVQIYLKKGKRPL